MATIISTLYPPQVDTFMPSFCYNESAEVWFNIASYDEDKIGLIKYIHVSMVDQRNNQNVFAGSNNNNVVYPQYYPIVFNHQTMWDTEKRKYKLTIPPQLLKTSPYYNVGQYYKVQLRFDLTGSTGYDAYSEEYDDPTVFFLWNNSKYTADALKLASYTNNNENNFSEWSTGTLIKPILIPESSIQNFDTSETKEIHPSTDVLFTGKIIFNKVNNDTLPRQDISEFLSWYQIKLLNNDKTIIYYNSEKIYPDSMNKINYNIDLSMLSIDTDYYIQLIYETNNGYNNIVDYPIRITDYTDSTNIAYSKTIDEENGIIVINISELENYSEGYLIVRRSSHQSNFTKWDLITAQDISSKNELEIIDNSIESMTGYRYQIQYITNDNIAYSPVYIEDNDILSCNFYGGLFSDNEKMLKISFNFQLSNRANAVNRFKVDTLGGQYPLFTQNSKLKYHTYSISGRISTEDNGELFLSKQEIFGLEYYNKRYNLTTISPHTKECQGIKSNNDWLYEREYRDAVEEWLNNGKPKLFRSMTEGNMIVILDGINMTPDIVLGRRLYDFSATMYEIGNGKDINSISSFGLFDIVDER